jgi:hypothetical protein
MALSLGSGINPLQNNTYDGSTAAFSVVMGQVLRER